MSKFYKYALGQVLLVWLLIVLSFMSGEVSSSHWYEYVIFTPPLLWISWIVCAITDRRNKAWLLVLLWCLSDLAILAIFYQRIGTLDNRPRSGAELVLFIDYFPFTLPLLIIGPLILGLVEKLSDVLFALSGHIGILAPNGVMRGWLEMSIPTAVLSIIFAYACRRWPNKQAREYLG